MDPNDPVEAIWSLADSVRDQTASFNGAKDLEPVEATDEAGVVHVMLDATGKVSDVRVAVGWQDRVSGDALGATIIRAISAAAQKRLVAWADAVVDPDRAVPPARPMQPPLSDSVSGRLTEIATAAAHMPAEAMEEVASTLREMNASLRALRGQMSAVLDARFTAESSSGHARVTVSGSGDMLEVEFDQTWLKYAHPANIGRECVAAMRVAFDVADKIALMLQTLTGGIIVFWVLLIAAIVKLVVCLVAAVGETATVIGAPAAPPTAGLGVGAFLATLGVGTAALLTTALVARANLSNAANDYSCFAGGHWPEAKLA